MSISILARSGTKGFIYCYRKTWLWMSDDRGYGMNGRGTIQEQAPKSSPLMELRHPVSSVQMGMRHGVLERTAAL